DAHRLVRRDRAVEEPEPRPAGVLLAQPVEHALALPELEDPLLFAGELGHGRESREGLRHGRRWYEAGRSGSGARERELVAAGVQRRAGRDDPAGGGGG